MKHVIPLAAASAIALFATGAAAQSAKFAANYGTDTVTLIPLTTLTGSSGSMDLGPVGTELLGKIRAPKGKELLIGVSGVANIVTFTEAKGRNGAGDSTSIAEGTLGLEVRYAPEAAGQSAADVCDYGLIAALGPLTFASRRQQLTVNVDLNLIDLDGTDEVTADDLGIDGTVTVALGLDTTAAHHFNFVAIDLVESAVYDVAACFTGTGHLEVSSSDIQDSNTAKTAVAIAHRMVTVQEVRAVKGSIEDTIN